MPTYAQHRRGLEVVVFFLLVLAVYAVTANYSQEQNNDISGTTIPVWSLVTHGTLDVTPYRDMSPWFLEMNGRVISNRWPGSMIYALPVYAVTYPMYAHHDDPVLWPGTITAVVVTAAAVAAMFLLLLLLHGRLAAWTASAIIAFGTGLWTVAADGLWTHGPGVLMSAFCLHALRAERQWAAGVCFGTLALIRPHLLLVAAVVGYITAREEHDWRALVRIGVPSAVGLSLYVAYVSAMVGRPSIGLEAYALVIPEGWGRLTNLLGVLLAPRGGLLLYTPVILCCLPVTRAAWRHAQPWERAALFGGITYLLVQFQLNRFFGGYSFYGYRLPLEGLTFAAPLLIRGAVMYAQRSQVHRATCAILSVISVWIHAVGAWLYTSDVGVQNPWTTFGPAAVLSRQTALVVGLALAALAGTVAAAPYLVQALLDQRSIKLQPNR